MSVVTTTAIGSIELLAFPPQSSRASQSLLALGAAARAAGMGIRAGSLYQGQSDLLILWGPGHPARFEPMRRQREAGGHVLALDLAYWQRDRKVRIAIDHAHPQGWVMRRTLPADRLRQDGVTMGFAWDPEGPVLIAGLGQKARVQYGADVVDAWEAAMRAEAERRGKHVIYRAKSPTNPPIEHALQGVSLVITWHSNVAIDAIRWGIPVICKDGAAAAVSPSTWGREHLPLPIGLREWFLTNLAWFQWDLATEADLCLAFVRELLT